MGKWGFWHWVNWRGWMLLVAVALTPACQPPSKVSPTNRLFHEVNTPLRALSPWQWQDVSSFEHYIGVFLPAVRRLTLRESFPIRDASDVRLKQANAALDQFWNHIQDEVQAQLGGEATSAIIPKPYVALLDDDDPNGAVFPVPLCVRATVHVSSSGPTEPPPPTAAITDSIDEAFLTPDGEVTATRFASSCRRAQLNQAEWVSLVAWLHASQLDCRIELRGEPDDPHIYFGKDCRVAPALRGKSARALVITQAANIILLQVGLFEVFDEQEIAAVVAHELSHYVRAHVTAPTRHTTEYNFLYRLGEKNPDGKPKFDPDLVALTNELTGIRDPIQRYRRLPMQKLRSELLRPAVTLAEYTVARMPCASPSSEGAPCKHACQTWFDFAQTAHVQEVVGGFPFQRLGTGKGGGTDALSIYRDYEDKLLTCLASLKMAEADRVADFVLPRAVVKGAFAEDANLFAQALQDIVSAHYADGTAVKDVFSAADRALQTLHAKLRAPLERAAHEHLGFYTMEQEADEYALEWLNDTGGSLQAAVTAEFKFAALAETRRHDMGLERLLPFEVGEAECRRLYQDDWLLADGRYQFIPVAEFRDIHQTYCYRAFNLAREIKAHRYEEAPGLKLPR